MPTLKRPIQRPKTESAPLLMHRAGFAGLGTFTFHFPQTSTKKFQDLRNRHGAIVVINPRVHQQWVVLEIRYV